jgi:hypothetical protein
MQLGIHRSGQASPWRRAFLAFGWSFSTLLLDPLAAGEAHGGLLPDLDVPLLRLETLYSGGFASGRLESRAPCGNALENPEEDLPFRVREGFYLLAMMPIAGIAGDFDGTTFFAGQGAILAVPEVDTGFGFGAGLGYRAERVSFDINFQRTYHDGLFAGVLPLDVVANAVNFDFKWFFFTDGPLQPNLLLGFGFPWLEVKDGSASIDGTADDATYVGLQFHLGGGLNYHIFPRWAIGVQGGYRFTFYLSGSGAGGASGSLDDTLDGSGWFAQLVTTFTF